MMRKIFSQRFARSSPVLIAAVLCLFILTAVRLRNGSLVPTGYDFARQQPGKTTYGPSERVGGVVAVDTPTKPAPGRCPAEIEILRRPELRLTDSIKYSRRCVKPLWTNNTDRDAIANVSQALVTKASELDLRSCSSAVLPPCEPLSLHVPTAYPPSSYAHLLFGVASKYDRLNDSLPAFAHWLSGSGAHLIGVVADATYTDGNGVEAKRDLAALERRYRAFNISASFRPPTIKEPAIIEHHHFMLVRDLAKAATPQTRWLGVLDDDTFFPSLYPLDQELARHDHTKPAWLGALSDDFDAVKNWGFMAFGGAGAFLSVPLARKIEPFVEQCMADALQDTGDGMLRDCVYWHSRAQLTIVPGLYQHDFFGDASGFFESGVRPLSLHHWKSWYREPVPTMAAVTDVCGDCFLQRWRFGRDTLFVNGYSITQYPEASGLDAIDLEKVEGTWDNPNHNFDFSYGSLRPKLERDAKKSYRLKLAEATSDGGFRQLYVYKADPEQDEKDEVVEFLWQAHS